MLIGIIVFLALSFLILAHEAGHFFAARFFKLKIDEFGFGFPPRIWAKKKGDVEYSLNWLPFGGFVKIAGENDRILGETEKFDGLSESERGRLFLFQKPWRRAVVILAGVAVNFVLGWLLLSSVFMVGTPRLILVSGVQSGSPAAVAGFKSGDVLAGYETSAEFIAFVNAHKGEEVAITVLRDAKEEVVKATPRKEPKPDEGALGVFLAESGVPRYGFFSALWHGLTQSVEIFGAMIVSFVALFKSILLHASIPEGVSGPVGIFTVAQEAGKLGLIHLVQLAAFISLNLAVLNLIPFPALDGGRAAFIAIEKLRGKPISVAVEGWINAAGFILLLVLMAVITVRDVIRL